MPKIHCVRHAQGEHNLCTANHVIPDPVLTDLGREQCHQLRDRFPHHDRISLIVASPLRRTIYTALNAFEPVLRANPDLKVVALPDIQETSDVPCDTGSELAKLEEEFKGNNLPVDLGLLKDGWQAKGEGSRYQPTNARIKERARDARRYLKSKMTGPDAVHGDVIMVSHGGFLHYFTEDWEDSSQYQGKLFSPWFSFGRC